MQIPVYSVDGKAVGQMDLDESVFGVPMNEAVVHQALVRQRANSRLGTVKTKTRAEVSGSSRKLYRQKHTGHARAGSLRSPLRRHGGVIFGPRPRSYRQAMPKKMRRLAIRCLLSDKVTSGTIRVVEKLELSEPKTREMNRILQALGIERSTLIALPSLNASVIRSASNLNGVSTVQARQLNVEALLSHRHLVMTPDAIQIVQELWGREKTSA